MAIRKELGEFLLENNLITRSQLNEARRIQRETGQRLGRVLVSLGHVREQDIVNALEFHLGIARVSLYDLAPDSDLVRIVPETLARRYKAVAVKKEGNKLTVAMADPLNIMALDDLRAATGCEIVPVLADEAEIDTVLDNLLSMSELFAGTNGEEEDTTVLEMGRFDLDDLPETAVEAAPVVRAVNSIIQQAVKSRASDVHLEPQEKSLRVRLRVDGFLRDIMSIPRRFHAPMISRIKIMAEMDIAERRVPQDGRVRVRVGGKEVDLRVSTLPTIFGEKAVIRLLDKSQMLLRLEDLGFNDELLAGYRSLIRRPYGMILVTGPTGSGKTTTLYATLNAINTVEKNIITIEDPVEYVLPGINQIQINPKAGLTFASGLRSILRQDPDVVMVGEIRDSETADIAIRAATTGHLVFSTLHTNDAAGTVGRLLDMGMEPFLVASSVVGVMAQRLVRVVCPHCKTAYELPPGAPERAFLGVPAGENLTLFKGSGCSFCNRTGYHGRVAVHELMTVTGKIRDAILGKASADDFQAIAKAQGMRNLRDDAQGKVLAGITTFEELMRVAYLEENEGKPPAAGEE
ncbi:MAG: type II/IV secretion system protein [Clostridia bacterium]|nr:MAG: type II/IV secretion system protein [Clostridia bacterium]